MGKRVRNNIIEIFYFKNIEGSYYSINDKGEEVFVKDTKIAYFAEDRNSAEIMRSSIYEKLSIKVYIERKTINTDRIDNLDDALYYEY